MKIFVTGGAGYIGSNFIRYIKEQTSLNVEIKIFDNLSTGDKRNILYGELIVGDLENLELLENSLTDFQPDVIVHFAASVKVEESVYNPLKYYENNFKNTINLIFIAEKLSIPNLLFSSTAAVYAENEGLVKETDRRTPINPYGHSKKMVEDILFELRGKLKINFGILRYFNVAGTDEKSRIGIFNIAEMTHLINKVVLSAIKPSEHKLQVFGNDYNTKDGTCIRDYIYMDDLVAAHVLLIHKMMEKKVFQDVFNVGYGTGYSVLEIIKKTEEILNCKIPYTIVKRRPGDAIKTVADNTKLMEQLGFSYNENALEKIILSTYNFIYKIS